MIRKMEPADIKTAVRWANEEGWQPGVRAEETFLAADAEGLLAGILDGEMISSLTAVSYDGKFGFIGMYIVKPGYRGKGYGISTWNAGISHLDGHIIGLDGVIAQQENYQKFGFRIDHRNERYIGHFKGRPRIEVSALDDTGLGEILVYEKEMFPGNREKLLAAWVAGNDVKTRVIRRNGRIAGYGVLRPCRDAVRIGPLFADDYMAADTLLDDLTSELPDGIDICLDIPKNNQNAIKLVESRGMKPVFETLRMYMGGFPSIRTDKIFGISSFELG